MNQRYPATEDSAAHNQQRSGVAPVNQGFLDKPNPSLPLFDPVAVTMRHPIGKKSVLLLTGPGCCPHPGSFPLG
jgi:hypothetical protein